MANENSWRANLRFSGYLSLNYCERDVLERLEKTLHYKNDRPSSRLLYVYTGQATSHILAK